MPGCFSGYDKGGRVRKSFPDVKTFRIERVNHDIFKLATKVHKTAVSQPIPKRKEAKSLFGRRCIEKVEYILWMIYTLSRSSGRCLDHLDTLQTIWTLFR